MKATIVSTGRATSETLNLCVDASLIVGYEPTVSVQIRQTGPGVQPHLILQFQKADRTALREWATGLLAAADFLDQEVAQ